MNKIFQNLSPSVYFSLCKKWPNNALHKMYKLFFTVNNCYISINNYDLAIYLTVVNVIFMNCLL